MEYALLRSLRALGPGLIILAYVDLFLMLALGKPPFFWGMDSAKLFLIGYVVGGVWGLLTYIFPRESRAFRGVNEKTISILSAFIPGLKNKSWKEISPCFYALIDNDKSLEQQSKGIYFNGFIVTISFEAMVVSFFAEIVGIGVDIITSNSNYLLLSGTAVIVSYIVWRSAVKRHCVLIAGQVNVIRRRFVDKFAMCLKARNEDLVGSQQHDK